MLLLTAMLLLGISGLLSLNRQLQMLQQNSYYPSRYYKWFRDGYCVEAALSALLFCGFSLLAGAENKIYLLLLAAAAAAVRAYIAVRQHKKSIKRLVYTARVKRLFAAAAVLLGALLCVCEIVPGSLAAAVSQTVFSALACVTPLLALAAWAVTLPIEKFVTRWFINDARRILRENPGIRVIGITGSYGKTTTKFILKQILSEKYNVTATPQSFNTPLGVVRTIRSDIKPQTQIFICEMGAKKPGDIKEICDIVHPDCGIITSVGEQHLDTFGSVDRVFDTKFELAAAVREKGGEVFVNGSSNGISERLQKAGKGRVFGTSDSEFYAENVKCSRRGSSFDLVLSGTRIAVTTQLLGMCSICDIVGAAAAAFTLGVPPDSIAFAVSRLKPAEHRLQLKNWNNGSLLIDDAYNANPEGSLEAVSVLGSFEGMRKVIITPGLIELGEREYECNYKLGLAAAGVCDTIILVGLNRSKPLREAVESTDFDRSRLHIVSSFAEAMEIYAPTADSGSVVLLENDLPDNYLN